MERSVDASMKYRSVVKPLTEKTANAPVKGEILVDTEHGNVSVVTDTGIRSATREIKAQLVIKRTIMEKINVDFSKVLAKLDTLEKTTFPDRLNALNTTITKLRTVTATVDSYLAKINQGHSYLRLTTQNILQLFVIVNTLAVTVMAGFEDVLKLEKYNEEGNYLRSKLDAVLDQLNRDINDLKALKTSVQANVDSRVDESTFETWKNGLLTNYRNLRSNSIVESINFVHNK